MSMKSEKRVYYFSRQLAEGLRDMRDLLGGKGTNIVEMASIGLPVPPGLPLLREPVQTTSIWSRSLPPVCFVKLTRIFFG